MILKLIENNNWRLFLKVWVIVGSKPVTKPSRVVGGRS
jgi:hypothetical protein